MFWTSKRCRWDALTNNLPLGAVLTPETDTVLSTSDSMFAVEVHHANTKVLPSLLNLSIRFPNIRTESLRHGIVRTVSETFGIGYAVGGLLEIVMGRRDLVAFVSRYSTTSLTPCILGGPGCEDNRP